MKGLGPRPKMVRASTAWFIGIIVVLGQQLITQWTVEAAGQRDVIDYVSFAGTITSMLLAVVAVVYAFYTATSQKSDADKIASQIWSLTSTVHTLDRSEVRLSQELVKLGEIRDQLRDVSDGVRTSGADSAATRDAVEKMAAELQRAQDKAVAARQPVSDAGGTEGGETDGYVVRIASSATDNQCPLLFAAYQNIVQDKLSFSETVDLYVAPFLRKPPSELTKASSNGEVFAYVMVLLDLGVGDSSPGATKAFLDALAQRVEMLPVTTGGQDRFDWERTTQYLKTELGKSA